MTGGFRNLYTTPTEEQAALVGHIVMDWAIVEWLLKALLVRLAGAPDYPGRALTDRSSAAQAADASRSLLKMHEERYGDRVIAYENRLAIRAALDRADHVRAARNSFAHRIGWRESDDSFVMVGLSSLSQPMQLFSTAELNALAAQIRGAAEAVEAALSLIPETPEP